jgi:thiamine biosynthesis protein ThiI
MHNTIIIHTNEIILKRGNRAYFENKLVENLARVMRQVPTARLRQARGGVVTYEAESDFTSEEVARLVAGLGRVFGVADFLLARRVADRSVEAVAAAARDLMADRRGSFKVYARRRDKNYPLTSMELAAAVGAGVLAELAGQLRVDVRAPDHAVNVEVAASAVYVAVGQEAGPGGLPSGTAGRVVALLSGGIDSPVAAWKLMRRGCEVTLIHFHSYPYVGEASLDKAERLAGILAPWQGGGRLWMVPLADAQREIAAKCRDAMRVVLYRRMMLRIAERLAAAEGAGAVVTGDALGQVASQTLANLQAVSAVATLPIFRPLIGDDKEDIIKVARRIGTFDVSIEAHEDCCSLFMPQRPETRAAAAAAAAEEAKLDVDGLVADAVAKAELREIIMQRESAV